MESVRGSSKKQLGEEIAYTRNLEDLMEPSKRQIRVNRENIIRKQLVHLNEKYTLGDKIGQGSFGEVFKVEHRELKNIRALKIISKSEETSKHDPYAELEILKKLDHPNVLKVYEYFQSEDKWLLITQFFEGRELFDEIIREKHLSERKAAEIFAEICKAVSYIHSQSIVHRDIKPENILVRKQAEGGFSVKLIDWGLGSLTISDLVRKCGTPEYCAPQVVRGSYGYECDLWSLGVLLYTMLCGKFPFKGSNIKETLDLVSKGRVRFDGEVWNQISIQAKNLISSLLVKVPSRRIRASQCLKHAWILNHSEDKENFNQKELMETLTRLKEVAIDNKFHAVVISFIRNYLSASDQEKRLKREFQYLDENKDGVLSYQELKNGYSKVYGEIQAEKIVERIFTMIDLDGSNKIEYSEFVTFASNISMEFSKEQLQEAFRLFDQDNNGKINKAEINELLIYDRGQSEQFDAIIDEIDLDGDGSIDIDEFIGAIDKAVKNIKTSCSSMPVLQEDPPVEKTSQTAIPCQRGQQHEECGGRVEKGETSDLNNPASEPEEGKEEKL